MPDTPAAREMRCPKCGEHCGFHMGVSPFQTDSCRIRELEHANAELREQLKIPNRTRDFVNEFNGIIKSKDATIASLEATVVALKEMLRGSSRKVMVRLPNWKVDSEQWQGWTDASINEYLERRREDARE